MASRLQPALFGGLFIGVLSALPFVSNLNACCCLWVIAGGVLATYLLQERTPTPVAAGDGALTGLFAGVVGAAVAGVLNIAFSIMMGISGTDALDQLPQGNMPPEFERVLEQLRNLPTAVWFIAPFVIYFVLFPIFAMLGGLLGVALFKKKLPPPAPGTMEVLPPE